MMRVGCVLSMFFWGGVAVIVVSGWSGVALVLTALLLLVVVYDPERPFN